MMGLLEVGVGCLKVTFQLFLVCLTFKNRASYT